MMTHFTSLTNSIFRQNEKSMVAQKCYQYFLILCYVKGWQYVFQNTVKINTYFHILNTKSLPTNLQN